MVTNRRPLPRWIIVAILTLCGFSTVACLSISEWPSTSRETPTSTWTPTTTRTVAPTETNSPTPTDTPSPSPERTWTSTPPWTPTPAPTSTPTPAPSPTLSPTFTPIPPPTPIVCTNLGTLGGMSITQGQRFICTTHQDQINEQIRNVPDMPCSEVSINLDDGQLTFECKMAITIRASGTVTVDNCQLNVQITEGTTGVSEVFQLMINQMLPNLPYEKVCFDQIGIDDGQMELAGYGR